MEEGNVDLATNVNSNASLDLTTMTEKEVAQENPVLQDFEKDVPDEYKQKPWYKELIKNPNPKVAALKQYEEGQKLLGQRAAGSQIPGKDATEEEKKAFYNQLGVPESVDGYKIEPVKWADDEKELGAIVEKDANGPILDAVKAEALRRGVTPEALNALINTYMKTAVTNGKAQLAEAAKTNQTLNDEFGTIVKQMHGANSEQVLDVGRQMIKQMVRPELQIQLHRLPNEALAIMATAAYDFHRNNIREDGFSKMNGSQSTALTVEDIKREGIKMMEDPAYTNPRHPDHRIKKAEVDAHFAQINRL